MGQRPITGKPTPSMISPLWFSFDPTQDDKELWQLEQEVMGQTDRINLKYCNTVPIGKTGNESNVDDEETDEEDDEDEEETDSPEEEDDDEEVDMDTDTNEDNDQSNGQPTADIPENNVVTNEEDSSASVISA